MIHPIALVTGANGFIARSLCETLCARGWRVRGTVRSSGKREKTAPGVDIVESTLIGSNTDWTNILHEVSVVVHLAARVHIMRSEGVDPPSVYREINALGTERLAKMAVRAGVKRMVFISTVKVNGQGSNAAYTEEDSELNPCAPYEISKWEAEQALKKIGSASDLEIIILRSPLVYGPGVKANFLALLKAVNKGIPLPFGGVMNRRSILYLGNLIDSIVTCMQHPEASGKTFFVSDGRDVSTPDLIRMIAFSMGKKPMLFSVPPPVLKYFGLLTGKQGEIERLTSSLFVDTRKISSMLGWRPPFSLETGIKHTVEWFKLNEKNL